MQVLARVAGEAADYDNPESEAARELSLTIAKLRTQLAAAEEEPEEEEEGGEAADASGMAALLKRNAKLQADLALTITRSLGLT